MTKLSATLLKLTALACVAAAPAIADDGPVRIGSVSALTGPFIFDEAPRAAEAVFERYNANGGIDGRMIEYLPQDDRFDPTTAAQVARRLVDELQVIGNVGSASVLECSVNRGFYQQRGIMSITGVGVDPACFSSPNFFPVNTGPYKGVEVTLSHLSENLGFSRICKVFYDVPGQKAGYDAAVANWEAATGKTLHLRLDNLSISEDTTPYLLQAQGLGCEVVLYNGVESQIVAFLRGAAAQQIDDVSWAFLTPAYTETMPSAIGGIGEGIVANAEFLPFTSDDPALEDWLELMAENKIPASAFAQAGYVAANLAIHVLESIEGEITRESFSEAIRNLEGYTSPFVGNAMSFSDGGANNPNFSSQFVSIAEGSWRVDTDWVSASN